MTEHIHHPRLSHVVKWVDFQGYGFNLHAEKGKAGQFIGKVDANSPAEAAGLKEGDRIIEVNGINIGNENHQQVVTRIKSGGDETRLLVVDSVTDNWYKEQKKIIRGDLPEVISLSAKRENNEEPTAQEPTVDVHYEYSEPPVEEPSNDVHHGHSLPPDDITPAASDAAHNGNGVNEDHSYRPRLCHLKIWPHFQGYGFNLHAEKDKPGQYIGLVDDDSPSSTGGLRLNDRIIEVNGVNIEQEKHTDVIARIKAIPGETKLLVVDKATDNYYKNKGITVSSSMAHVEHFASPDPSGVVNGLKPSFQHSTSVPEHDNVVAPPVHSGSTVASVPASKPSDGLELNLSVAEMKERLRSMKRQDPRLSKVPFEQKFKEFQRM